MDKPCGQQAISDGLHTDTRKVSKLLKKCEDSTRSGYQFRPCSSNRRSRYSTEEDTRKTGEKKFDMEKLKNEEVRRKLPGNFQ